jgi:hypothetical protein
MSHKYHAQRGPSYWTSLQGRDPESILTSNGFLKWILAAARMTLSIELLGRNNTSIWLKVQAPVDRAGPNWMTTALLHGSNHESRITNHAFEAVGP